MRLQVQLQKALRRMLQAHGYESDRVVRLATKLRLSQMSRYRRADAAFAAPKDIHKPWTDWGTGPQQK
jgi:hypothetical protein